MDKKKLARIEARCRAYEMTVESYENAMTLRPLEWSGLLRPYVLRWSARLLRIRKRLEASETREWIEALRQ